MKKLHVFLTIAIATVLMACNTTKSTTTTDNSQSSDMSVTSSDTDESRRVMSNDSQNTSEGARTGVESFKGAPYAFSDYDLKRRKQLYSDLDMTEEQIQRYEKESISAIDQWRASNAEREMNSREKMDYESRSLKPILSPTQYNSYQRWSITNPYN